MAPDTNAGTPLQEEGWEEEFEEDDDTEIIEYGLLIDPLVVFEVVVDLSDNDDSNRGREAEKETENYDNIMLNITVYNS